METLFRTVLNMSVTGAVVICAVLLLRAILRRAPKRFSYWLWSAAGFRLVCPVSWNSAFSLFSLAASAEASIPAVDVGAAVSAVEYVPRGIGLAQTPRVELIVPAVSDAVSAALPAADPFSSANPMQLWMFVGARLWLIGAAAMLLWGAVSYLRLARRLRTAVRLSDGVWQSDAVDSPFLMGLFRPRIYIPFGLEGERLDAVLAHERFHRAHRDDLVKLLAFLILALHWFDPLVWLAFRLMGRDMEMRCDEAVLGGEAVKRRPYSETLLSFAAERRFPGPGPLAFGESGVRARIKNALRWKKPRLWVSLLAGALCVAAVAACAANPAKRAETPEPLSPAATSVPTAAAAAPDGPGANSSVEMYLRTETLRDYEENGVELYDKAGNKTLAEIAQAELSELRITGRLDGLAPEGQLQSWRYRVRLQLAEDAPEFMPVGGMTLSDGWLDPDGAHDLIALVYPNDRLDVLYDAPVNDGMSFLGYHASYEEALYDWYAAAYGLDVPPCVLDWGEALSAGGNFPVRRFDGDGWYVYMPLSGWTLTENTPARRRWESAYGTGSSIVIREARAEELAADRPALAEGQAERCVSAPDGRYWLVFTQYDPKIDVYSSWAGKEPEILRLMLESFRVTGAAADAPFSLWC